jgi:RHS repeat-associated protein
MVEDARAAFAGQAWPQAERARGNGGHHVHRQRLRQKTARDAQGRTTQVNVQRPGAASEVLLNQASYHPFGPVAGWTYGNGRQLQRPLNQNYQPTAIQDAATGGLSVGFAYDPVGNLTQLTPAGTATPLIKFDYDALSRLTAFKDGPTNVAIESYAYDDTGNRQSFTNSVGTQAYTYPSTSHRLSQVGATARSYDNAGNTTAIGGIAREFVYDDTGRMAQVKQNAIAQRNYQYNGKGEQVRKYLGTTNTYTVYDEAGHWLGDYDNTGAALQQALWLDDLPVGLIANGNQLHYIESDHLGTPRVVVEVARNVPVWTWDLKSEAFGNSVPNQDPDGDATPLVFDMRFPGQQYDADTELNYNYFRDYDPSTGRYATSDPIGLSGGVSTYGYVAGNPIENTDRFGLSTSCSNPRNLAACIAAGNAPQTGTGSAVSAVAGAAGATGTAILGATSSDARKQCDDKCEQLYQDVRFWLQDVKDRYWKMKVDKLDLFRTRPTGNMSWQGHIQQFRQSQGHLRDALLAAEAKTCLNTPLGAWTWATMAPPDAPFPKP